MANIIFEQHVNPFFQIVNPQVEVNELPDAGPFQGVVTSVPRNVQTDQEVRVNFTWEQTGILCNLPNLPIEFRMEFFFELMGAGEVSNALNLSAVEPYVQGVGSTYSASIIIPPGTVPVGNYKCVSVFKVGFNPSTALPDTPFAGFAEFPFVNFYLAS